MSYFELYAPITERKICAFRRGDAADSTENAQAECKNKITHIITEPWAHFDSYYQAYCWLKDNNCGKFNKDYVIDGFGTIYNTTIEFNTMEDKIIFLLKFPELK